MNKNMMKQAQQLQARLSKAQEDLENEVVEASAGGGVVKVTVSGKLRIQSVKISEEATEEIDMLQDLILAVTNESMFKAHQLAQDKLNAITGGFKIPGLT